MGFPNKFNDNNKQGGGKPFNNGNNRPHNHQNNTNTNNGGGYGGAKQSAAPQQQAAEVSVNKPKRGDFFNDRSKDIANITNKNANNTNNGVIASADGNTNSGSKTNEEKIKEAQHAKNILLNAANGASVGTMSGAAGMMGQVITRRVQYLKYRKPHTIEYPSNAIVLNPKHAVSLQQSLKHANVKDGYANGDDADGGGGDNGETAAAAVTAHSFRKGARPAHQEDCNDDPRVRELPEILCTEEVFQRNLQLTWKSVGNGCGAGLINCGNTCFANAVLQCFAFTPPFAQFLMQNFVKSNQGPDVPFDYAYALAETIRSIHNSGGGGGGNRRGQNNAIKPGLIIGNLKGIWKGLVLGRQCDSFEFGQQLITKAQESVLRRMIGARKVPFTVQHTTPFMRVAGGYERSQVSWSKNDEIEQLKKANNKAAAADLAMDKALVGDKMVSNTYEHFTMMTLAVVGGNTLPALLADYYKKEKLDGRIYTTERKVKVIAFRQISLHIPPPSLMIHLKRFDNSRNKINKPIAFPKTLDMLPYCSPNADVKEALYDLCAVTVHIGRATNYGHYIAYVKGKNGLWYLCDDETVRQVSENEVLKAQALIVYYSITPSSYAKLTTPTPLLKGKNAPKNNADDELAAFSLNNSSNNKKSEQEDAGVEMSEDDIQKAMRAAKAKMLKDAEEKERRALPTDSESSSSDEDEDEEEGDEESADEEEDDNTAAAQPKSKAVVASSSSPAAPKLAAAVAAAKPNTATTTAAKQSAAADAPLTKKAASVLKDKNFSNVYSNNSDDDGDDYEDNAADDSDADNDDEVNTDDDDEEEEEEEAALRSPPKAKKPLLPPTAVSPKFAPIIATLADNSKKSPKHGPSSSAAVAAIPPIAPAISAASVANAKTITVQKGSALPKSLGKFAGLMSTIQSQKVLAKVEAEEEKAFLEAQQKEEEAAGEEKKKKNSSAVRVNVFAPKTIVRSGEEVRKMRVKRARGDEDEEEEDGEETTVYINGVEPATKKGGKVIIAKQVAADNTYSNNEDEVADDDNHANDNDNEGEVVETVPFSREAYTKALHGEGDNAVRGTTERKRHQGLFKSHLRDEEWAAEFDRGKIKKVRTEQRMKEDDKFCKANQFQVAQNQKLRGEFVPKYRPSEEEKKEMRREARGGGGGGGRGFGGRGGGFNSGRGGNGGYGDNQQRRPEGGSRRISFD